ncbi:hypothetical protein Leryth_022562 [Lithospermum erythrorhizon]|nr:hypothetical protein Leryth_022562 [Lithospermum erythrorhizon]
MNIGQGGKSGVKRNLPSWMSARGESSKTGKGNPSYGGSSSRQGNSEEGDTRTDDEAINNKSELRAKSVAADFSNLMEGVVFVLSGFVNPERATLRSQALEMGAQYQQDWNSDCTLLVCAFPNTPKYRQVASDGGTIVSKEWISECHEQKKLVEIEPYMMHAGKPWKRQSDSRQADKKRSASQKSVSQGVPAKCVEEHFSSSEVKKWAADDLRRTISWLENQDDKPEPGEIQGIAAEGVLTFLQDTIDALQQGQDIENLTEQWAHIPLVVEELAKFDRGGSFPKAGKKELCKHAMACKRIYELELHNAESSLSAARNEPKEDSTGVDDIRNEVLAEGEASYDSDETIEMTEEDIDQAYNTVVASTIVHA